MKDFQLAERLRELPPYLFAEIDALKREMMAKRMDIIDLGVGDPDLPTPAHIITKLKEAVDDPVTHRYPSYSGMEAFREAAGRWFEKRFGVNLDPRREVLSLIGSKEGIAHIPLAFVDPGDIVLVPDPAYPVYLAGTVFAGGRPFIIPLRAENGFLPDLNAIPEDIARRAKMFFLNYPNNPTSATVGLEFLKEVVEFATRYEIILCHDAAYSELSYDGYKAPSILQVEGAREVAIEFHSLSKTYNMTGWRVGFAVGCEEIISGLGRIKTNVDSGVFMVVQWAAVAALDGDQGCVEEQRAIYRERRDILIEGLKRAGLELKPPLATFYVWVPVPRGYTSTSFTMHLMKEMGIVTTPGNGFGQYGEGYVRMALTVDKGRIEEAVDRILKKGF